jgi:lipoprotein-anchoring transpeptidase ErfK/SrfK
VRPLVAGVLLVLVGMSGCQSGHGPRSAGAAPRPRFVEPADGATNVPTATEITLADAGTGTVTVSLTGPDGWVVPGAFRADGSSWVPAEQLRYATRYGVVATRSGPGGSPVAVQAGFTTMARPSRLVDVHSFLGDGQVVGVGMPVVVDFGVDVPPASRADVQRRLFVHSAPSQVGGWNWFNGHEVHYRPREHWRPGTTLDIRIATGGLPWGASGWYGGHDVTVTASVGDDRSIVVDNATKSLTVTRNGHLLRTVPVSLGKPSAPSSTGNLVVMSRDAWEWFDSSTYGVPVNSPDGYRTKVYWDLRLTWGGEFIHAAPWSVADQGHRNVSHGCVNIDPDTAKWLYTITAVGDPVTVRGTERHVAWGDGWTDWDRPWSSYAGGAAGPPSGRSGTSPAPSRS